MNKEQKIQVIKTGSLILAFLIMAVAVGYSLYLSYSIADYIKKNAPHGCSIERYRSFYVV